MTVGKVIEKVRITNVFDPTRTMEVDAVIDTGATMAVLPENIVNRLGLQKTKEVKVKYENNKKEMKSIYTAVSIEIQGRVGTFDVLAEENGSQPLIGQVVLEVLDLVVDTRRREVYPDPSSPEMPMIEILSSIIKR